MPMTAAQKRTILMRMCSLLVDEYIHDTENSATDQAETTDELLEDFRCYVEFSDLPHIYQGGSDGSP